MTREYDKLSSAVMDIRRFPLECAKSGDAKKPCKTIEELLDSYNISWKYGDKVKVEKTVKMFENFIGGDVDDERRSN